MAKVAIITGGTKGIGRGIGLALAREGYDLAVNYRRDADGAKRFEAEVAALGQRALIIEADQTQDGALDRLFDETGKAFGGGLDVFIPNAAATAFLPLMSLKPHQIDKTLSMTIKAYIVGAQRSVPMMAGRKGASIVAISGMDTIHTVPFHGLLGAAKAAMETLTRYLASELAIHDIRVNAVNPGFIDTDSTRYYAKDSFQQIVDGVVAMAPAKRIGTPEDVAACVSFLISQKAEYITGQTLHVDGGIAVAPMMMARVLSGK